MLFNDNRIPEYVFDKQAQQTEEGTIISRIFDELVLSAVDIKTESDGDWVTYGYEEYDITARCVLTPQMKIFLNQHAQEMNGVEGYLNVQEDILDDFRATWDGSNRDVFEAIAQQTLMISDPDNIDYKTINFIDNGNAIEVFMSVHKHYGAQDLAEMKGDSAYHRDH